MNTTKHPSMMILRQPAMRWQDACPIGNGTIGVMPYGHLRYEQILLNHERLFRRTPRPPLADVSDLLPQVRDLLRRKQYAEAQDLYQQTMLDRNGPGGRPDPYLPLGWLHMDVNKPSGVFTNYRRGVDFGTAEAWTRWTLGDTAWQRRYFVSRTEDVIVVHQRADRAAEIDTELFFLANDRFGQTQQQWSQSHRGSAMGDQDGLAGDPWQLPVTIETRIDGQFFSMVGQTSSGLAYGAIGRVTSPDAEFSTRDTAEGPRLTTCGGNELLVQIKLFVDESPNTALTRLRTELAGLSTDYDDLLAPHAKEHSRIFNRCRLSLGSGDDGSVPNEDLLAQAYDGHVPLALIERMHNFGRHLLICSSGEFPANLQGVWNGDYAPAWSSDYHNDENIQMNYWQALPGNMPEVMPALLRYYASHLDDYRENARKLYGCRGIMLPIAQTMHGLVYDAPWVYWTAAAGWIAQHFYDLFAFTGDKQTLEKSILPWLIECLEFYEDFCVEGEDGKLHFSPSLSPENTPALDGCSMTTVDATMDIAVCRELCTNLRNACEVLGGRNEISARCDDILSRLPDYRVNEDGAIREWLSDEFPDNYHHRHQSHLYPVFPGLEITPESSPELFEACRIAVEKRLVIGLSSQTGWSMAHMANIYARLGQGDRAGECLDILTRVETGPNLLTYHNDWRGMGMSMPWIGSPPFQVDANFGFAAAVLEMLVVSTPDCIRILPGLPTSWSKGEVRGLACRGGVTLGLSWDSGGKLTVDLLSRDGGEVTLRFPRVPENIVCADLELSFSLLGDNYRMIDLPTGTSVTLVVNLGSG